MYHIAYAELLETFAGSSQSVVNYTDRTLEEHGYLIVTSFRWRQTIDRSLTSLRRLEPHRLLAN